MNILAITVSIFLSLPILILVVLYISLAASVVYSKLMDSIAFYNPFAKDIDGFDEVGD